MRRWMLTLLLAWLVCAGHALHVSAAHAQDVTTGPTLGGPGTPPATTGTGAGTGTGTGAGQGDTTASANGLVDTTENELIVHTTLVPSGILNTVNGWGINFFTTTPADLTYTNKELQSIWFALSLVSIGSLGLSTLWQGFKIVHAPWSGAKPVRNLWLVGFGVLSILLSLVFCAEIIGLNNILCVAGGSTDPATIFRSPPTDQNDIALLVAGLLFEIAAAFVALKLVVRMVMVMVLTALSSLGFYAWTQPETKWLGQIWLYGFIGWTMGQFLTVTVMKIGLLLTMNVDNASRTGTTVSAYILGLLILVFAYGMPELLARYVGMRTGVPGVLSTVGGMVLSRSLGMAMGAGRAAGSGAASAGGAAAGGAASSGWTAAASRKVGAASAKASSFPGGRGPHSASGLP